jgi:hypothetical protein
MQNRLNHWAKRLFAKHRFVPVDLVPDFDFGKHFIYRKYKSLSIMELSV